MLVVIGNNLFWFYNHGLNWLYSHSLNYLRDSESNIDSAWNTKQLA